MLGAERNMEWAIDEGMCGATPTWEQTENLATWLILQRFPSMYMLHSIPLVDPSMEDIHG